MFTLEDLNNVVAFLLEEQGPLTPVEIRQFLDRLAEEHKLPVDLTDEIFNRINENSTLRHSERVLDSNLYPPMREITQKIETWMENNPERRQVVHLFFSQSMEQRERRVRRDEWERNHPGQEEIVEHEFTAGNADLLTEEQRRELRRILIV